MKWVLIEDVHVNMNQVEFFCWRDGVLVLFFNKIERKIYEDPDKKHYTNLCHQLGVRHYEEVKE